MALSGASRTSWKPPRTVSLLYVKSTVFVARSHGQCAAVVVGDVARDLTLRIRQCNVGGSASLPVQQTTVGAGLFGAEIRPRDITASRTSLDSSIPQRIDYKLAVLTFRCLHGQAPSYLTDSLLRTADVESRRRLRSAMTNSLVVLSTRWSTIGDRSFAAAASWVWTLEQPAVDSHVVVVTDYLQASTENWTFYTAR